MKLNKLKKAAMFGLDARIALAIFGALSVISGAALYSAIQHSKVIAAITTMQEIGKAYEQYVLDTGQDLELNLVHPMYFNILDLIVKPSGVSNWSGPYLPYSLSSEFSGEAQKVYFEHPDYKRAVIHKGNSTSWGVDSAGFPCTATDCYIWPRIDDVSLNLANAIDMYIDGSVDHKNGKVRIYYDTDNSTYLVWLQTGMPLTKP